jgi:DNA-binding MarR family transcriptional regulator
MELSEEKIEHNHWINIPPHILNIPKEELSWFQKLIYGKVAGLTKGKRGCCYASNKHLSNLMQCSISQITHTLSILNKMGLIEIELIYSSKGEVMERRIYVFLHTKENTISNTIEEGYSREVLEGIAPDCEVSNTEYSNNKVKEEKEKEIYKEKEKIIFNVKRIRNGNGKHLTEDTEKLTAINNSFLLKKEILNTPYLNLFPDSFQKSPKFQKSWSEWIEYRNSSAKLKMTKFKAEKHKRDILEYAGDSIDLACKLISHNYGTGWLGFVLPQNGGIPKEPFKLSQYKKTPNNTHREKIDYISEEKGATTLINVNSTRRGSYD